MAIKTVDESLWAHEAGSSRAEFIALRRLAEAGDAQAFHMLGYMYDRGTGTRRSRAQAMRWYLKGYEAGESISAVNIATMYRDEGRAKLEFDWYRRAAAMGDGDATLEVALRLLSGKGVRRDRSQAVVLLRKVLRLQHTSQDARDTARQLLHACEYTVADVIATCRSPRVAASPDARLN